MNDYVADLTDYNHRDRPFKPTPVEWVDDFYDFTADKIITFNGFRLDDEFSPFQKKLQEYNKKL